MGKLYFLIESGSVASSNATQLPPVYKNISNFYALEYDNPSLLPDLAWSGNPNQGFYEATINTMPTCSIYYNIVTSYDVNTTNYTVVQSYSTSIKHNPIRSLDVTQSGYALNRHIINS